MKSSHASEISSSIRLLRKEKILTQVDLSKKLSVKQSTVSRWENGVDEPSGEHLPKLVKVLECTYDELYGGLNKDFAEERELLNNFRNLTKMKKKQIMQFFYDNPEEFNGQNIKAKAQHEINKLLCQLLNKGLTTGELKIILFDQIENLETVNDPREEAEAKSRNFARIFPSFFARKPNMPTN
ncbi:MAG: helix-turn-helix transcriptional regulator [Emcibacteraceae bacterium]